LPVGCHPAKHQRFLGGIHATSRLESARAMRATDHQELEKRGAEANTGDSSETSDLSENSDSLLREAE
jgi:hypothetical protein